MSRLPILLLTALVWMLQTSAALAFCGFYVAKADTDLFNRASKVVLVRDGHRTVMTMANDFRGEPREFALVVPVPTFIERGQIHVGNRAVIEHLDAYSAPRLVEYHDRNPCDRHILYEQSAPSANRMEMRADDRARSAKSLGVTIEARYIVGEYDILILSAEESDGLETWLRRNDYRIPRGASRVLGSYIRQKMRFVVARVNLEQRSKLGYSYLRPLQIAFESPKFMLPIRLGTLNADGPQELFVFVLSRGGRVETTNYRTVKLPANLDLPVFIRDDFADFYRDMFAAQVDRQNMKAVFLEYAWDMGWCDPCAADPLSDRELRELGVFWTNGGRPGSPGGGQMGRGQRRPITTGARDVFITRLHLRYTADTFPEDLFFQETGDRSNFQGRYVIRHPWTGSPSQCGEARRYFDDLRRRQEREAESLASLTGWDLGEIHRRMRLDPVAAEDGEPWWKKLWSGDG